MNGLKHLIFHRPVSNLSVRFIWKKHLFFALLFGKRIRKPRFCLSICIILSATVSVHLFSLNDLMPFIAESRFAWIIIILIMPALKKTKKRIPGKETLAFWEKNISLIEEPFLLPTDQLRPRRFDYLGLKKGFCLSAEQSAACDAYCEANGLSAYMLFVGVWGILLSKAAGNFDFLIGTPVSGRNRREFWDIFGAFINTLPLRLTPSRNITAADYLKMVREQVVGMLDHQDITAEELLEITGTERSLDKTLFIVFCFQ